MKKTVRALILMWIVVCIVLIPMQSFAHSGGTDADGGHIDHSTGEYHWHHGYGPHQHYDMNGDGILECPILYGSSQNNDNAASSTQNNRTISRSSGTSYASTASPQSGQAHTTRLTNTNAEQKSKTVPNWLALGYIPITGIGLYLLVKYCKTKTELKNTADKMQQQRIAYSLEQQQFESDFQELSQAIFRQLGGNDILKLAQAPEKHDVAEDGMPMEIDDSSLKWGRAYTFYCSERSHHPKYHRAGCRYCNSGAAINAYQLKRRRVEPCLICKPQFPDLEWYERYLKLKGIIERHGENKV